jgi:CheY-like chemotaxis protein
MSQNERPARILLVDDNEGDVFLVRRALEKLGLPHELQIVRDGEEAVAFLKRAAREPAVLSPAVIVLDLNLPRIDGFAVLAQIRGTPSFSRTPVVIMTSSDSPEDRELTLRLGANAYFRKPTELNAFMELGPLVARILDANPAA